MAQVKRIRRNVSGVLILDKPRGMSSNAALQKVRWLLNAEKAGHTGSLDPLATGVLPLCFGEATKFSQYLLDADKGYETLARLGVTTTTGDAEGEVLEERQVTVGREALEAVLPRFRGEIEQVPPMYSALKKDGQPLYKLARAGEVVEREARSVTIARLELLAFEAPCATLAVSCSKGTYIRTLVEDIGRELGCGAHVAALRRTQAGPFGLAQAVTLEELVQVHAEGGNEALDRFLLPVDAGYCATTLPASSSSDTVESDLSTTTFATDGNGVPARTSGTTSCSPARPGSLPGLSKPSRAGLAWKRSPNASIGEA